MRNGIRAEIAESGEHSDPSGCRENSPAHARMRRLVDRDPPVVQAVTTAGSGERV
ncbi:MAG: hypothetical protein ACI91Q_001431, partial [Gammaproteobacteria bacterium]